MASLALASACDGDAEPVALEASVELLDSFSYDTGELPGSGPVQVSLKVSGSATAKVHMPAVASDGALFAAAPGTIEVSGGFFLDGTLKVDQTGLPKYDGDLPGLADVSLPISGTTPVNGFAIDEPVTVSAVIQPGDLPPIPLPGGLPGTLQLSVGEGSTIDVTLEGTCASVDGSTAAYQGTAIRAGTVNLDIAVEIDTGIAGTKSFDIGTVAIPLPEAGYDVAASAEGVSTEDAPEGAKAAPACEGPPDEEEGSGEGGAGVTPSTNKGNTTSTTSSGPGPSSTSSGNTSSTSSGNSSECSLDQHCEEGEVCRQGACKEVLELCINQTLHIGDLNLIEGDAEFGGHGPDVQVDFNPVATSSGVDVNIHVKMRETQSDWTTGERSQTFSFQGQVGSVVSPPLSWNYTDDDNSDDGLGGFEGLILSGKCSADTWGDDVCNGSNCSWCEIEVGCIRVTAP
ncbi:MAG: hypothetical protein HOV80_29750 [Polyangiaceae bacterium]|nr:hypothetical protein [Polyangiaceae bacterium]